MRAYMGYSRSAGAHEGALLIFAHSVKEARQLTYKHGLVGDGWIDMTATWLPEPYFFKYADRGKILWNIPHVVDDVPLCIRCKHWGCPLDDEGVCSDCREEERR